LPSDHVTVAAQVDQPVVLTLQVNPTTGYLWHPIFDEAVVVLQDRRFERTSNAVGSAGTELFTFIPKRAGRAEIMFDLRRPWEQNAREHRHYTLEVTG
jgi:predicted secreted protein